jgi:hypothetical protein
VPKEPAVDGRCLGRGVIDDHIHGEALRHAAIDEVQEATKLGGAVASARSATTLPEAISRAAQALVVP